MRLLNGGHFALGITVGAGSTLITLLQLDFFGTGASTSTELWAAMIGAILGGGVSLAMQYLQNEHLRFERAEEKNFANLTTARTLFLTVEEIIGGIRTIRKHVESCFSLADAMGEKYRSVAVQQTAGTPSIPRISIESKVLLLAYKEVNLFNSLNTQDIYARTLIEAYEKSQTRRTELLDLMDLSMMTVGEGFMPVPGKEPEVKAQNEVLERGFTYVIEEIIKTENNLMGDLKAIGELLQKLGDGNFQFDLAGN